MDANWEAAIQAADAGLASATRVVGFFKIMAVTEREYGNKLLMSTNFKRDGSLIRDDVASDVAPVSAVWDAFQRQIYERGTRSVKLASTLENITDDLENWIKDQQGVKKGMVDESYKLKKELAEHLQSVKRTEAARDAACAEADKLVEVYLKGRDAAQKKKAKHAVQEAGKAAKDYREAVHDANKYRNQFTRRLLPDLLDELRTFERSRISTLKNMCLRLQAAVAETSPSNPSWIQLLKLIDDVDAEKLANKNLDIGSSDPAVAPAEVVPYDAGFPDFAKSRLARLKGNEDVAPITKSPRRGTGTSVATPQFSASSATSIASSSSPPPPSASSATASSTAAANGAQPPGLTSQHSTHFAQVMPNTVVALGVESKREILRAQLSQLQQVILTEKRVLQDLISLIRFYGPGPAANRAREDYLAQKKKFDNMLGARKQVFAAMEMVGTTPSVLSTLRKMDRYATAPVTEKSKTESTIKRPDFGEVPDEKLDTSAHPSRESKSAPSLQEKPHVKGYGLYSYKAATEKELSFGKYEVLYIRDMDESGWWYCENKEGVLGFCPANFLKPLAPGEEAPVRKKKKKASAGPE